MQDKRIALITGGSGGIGIELAKLLARDAYTLILVALTRKELEDARAVLHTINPEIDIFLLEKDLTNAEAATQIHEFTSEHKLKVDVLINCAGFGSCGYVNDTDIDEELAMLQLHVCTLYHLTRLYLREMIERDEGYIINMASIAAFQPNPGFATYGASKAFVMNFSRALNYELREMRSMVKVMAVCPVAVRGTGFMKRAKMERIRAFNSWMNIMPEKVAAEIYKGMMHGKDIVVPGRAFSLGQKMVSLLPVSWKMKISRAEMRETI